MAKLLIIEDHLLMVQYIGNQMKKLNANFKTSEIYFFDKKSKDKLYLNNLQESSSSDTDQHISFVGEDTRVYKNVYQFLEDNNKDNVLILIDVLLKSQNIDAPSMEKYVENHEFSCSLYTELVKIKNGKKAKKDKDSNGNYEINPDNFYFIIYSRSDASLSVVTPILSSLYDTMNDDDKKFFPRESCLSKNISWCKNRCELTEKENLVKKNQEFSDSPLALSSEFRSFIEKLT